MPNSYKDAEGKTIDEFLCYDSGKYIGRIVEGCMAYSSSGHNYSTYTVIVEKEKGTPIQTSWCGYSSLSGLSMAEACDKIRKMTE